MSASAGSRRPPVTLVYRQRLTEEWLRRHYLDHEQSIEQVARRAGVCTQTIQRALRRHGIELRPRDSTGAPYSLGEVLTEEYLRQAYETDQRTVRDIATEVGCSETAVMARLRSYEIPRRGAQAHHRSYLERIVDIDTLDRRWRAGDTAAAIAHDLGVDPGTVAAYARRLGLSRP